MALSENKKVAPSTGLAKVCGEVVAEGNLRRRVAQALKNNCHRTAMCTNINRSTTAMCLTHPFKVLSDPNH